MTQSVFSCDVAAGKTANDGITLLSSDLDQAGIKQIQNVEFTFHVFDTDTYEIVSAAPLFDHNVSLLCYAEKEDFNEKYIKSRIPKLYDSFSDLAKAVLYPDARRRLINMKNFEFEDKSKFALPEWRVKELERIIRNQIKLILD